MLLDYSKIFGFLRPGSPIIHSKPQGLAHLEGLTGSFSSVMYPGGGDSAVIGKLTLSGIDELAISSRLGRVGGSSGI